MAPMAILEFLSPLCVSIQFSAVKNATLKVKLVGWKSKKNYNNSSEAELFDEENG